MMVLTKNEVEVFKGGSAFLCLAEIIRREGVDITVSNAIAEGYSIDPWVCPGHKIEAGVCVKCGFKSSPESRP